MAKIRHIAVFTKDPEKLAEFYVDVFGMKLTGRGDDRTHWLTDGYIDMAIILPEEDAPMGVNHFGFTLDVSEKAQIYEKLAKRGSAPRKPPPGRPYIEDAAYDPDGNKFDLSTRGLRVDQDYLTAEV